MKCPGQDTQYWKPGAIYEVKCPECHKQVEFFKDDTSRKCPSCGHRFVNPKMDFGCAAYCPYAEQCLGTLPDEAKDIRASMKSSMFKEKVAIEVKKHLKQDFKRIGRVMRTARYAEEIGKQEDADLSVLIPAACLVEVEKEKAMEILKHLGAQEQLQEKVYRILSAVQKEGDEETNNGLESVRAVLMDAYHIANMEDRLKKETIQDNGISRWMDRYLSTETGKAYAKNMFM